MAELTLETRFSRRRLRETPEPLLPPMHPAGEGDLGSLRAEDLQGAGQSRSIHSLAPLVRNDEQAQTNDIVGLATRFGRYGIVGSPDAPAKRLDGEPQTGGAYLAAGGAQGTGRAAQERPAVAREGNPCVGL